VDGRWEHPATLLLRFVERMQAGRPVEGVGAALLYLEHCAAVEDKGGGPAPLPVPLGLEPTVWLLELCAGLAALGCTAGTREPAFLPAAVAAALQHLPVLGNRPEQHAALFTQPDQMGALIRRVGGALEAAATRAAAGPVPPPQLAGRLVLAAGALLASAALHVKQGAPRFATIVLAPLCMAATIVAAAAAPARGPGSSSSKAAAAAQQQLSGVNSVRGLVGWLQNQSRALGTSLVLVEGGKARFFDGFAKTAGKDAKKGGGHLDALAARSLGSRLRNAVAAGAEDRRRLAESGPPRLGAVQRMLDTGESEEMRRAAAALHILGQWRASRARRARAAALLTLRRSALLRHGLLRWRGRFRQEAQIQAAEAAQRAAREAQEAAWNAQRGHAAAAVAHQHSMRFAGIEAALQQGLVHPSSCPVCPLPVHAYPGGAPLPPLPLPVPGELSAAAPAFLPHVYTPEHAAGVSAFQAVRDWYLQEMVPLLTQGVLLIAQLHQVAAGGWALFSQLLWAPAPHV
jgi:hypothetical protein